jgi:hypothetical protein
MKNLFAKLLLIAVIFLTTVSTALPQGVKRTIAAQAIPYSLSGGTAYCAGQPGPHILLSGSETGKTYQLRLNTINLGSPFTGTGTAIDFGMQTGGGAYDVIATDIATGCTTPMANTTTVTVNPIPTVTITASGPTTFCGAGNVTLTGDGGPGCTYSWNFNGSPNGNTTPVCVASIFGMYTCNATNLLGCSNQANQMVQVNPLPQTFTITGSAPTFCQGGIGITVNQNGSQTGVNYQLMLNGLPTGTPVGGMGLALSWPNQNVAGVYTVQATDNTTSCTSMMNGSTVVAMDPLPDPAGVITGPTTICEGSIVSFSTNNILNATSYMWSVPLGSSIQTSTGTTITVLLGSQSGSISVFGQNS